MLGLTVAADSAVHHDNAESVRVAVFQGSSEQYHVMDFDGYDRQIHSERHHHGLGGDCEREAANGVNDAESRSRGAVLLLWWEWDGRVMNRLEWQAAV